MLSESVERCGGWERENKKPALVLVLEPLRQGGSIGEGKAVEAVDGGRVADGSQ